MARFLGPAAIFGSAFLPFLLASHDLGQAKADPKEDSPLQLELQPAEIVEGMPGKFVFRLVNQTDHEVQLPTPTVKCTGGIDGTVALRAAFHPLHPRNSLGSGSFCDGGIFRPLPSILIRLQSWKIVKAGEVMTLGTSWSAIPDREPGKYEFWATYTPPLIDQVDQKFLQDAGIDFPRSELVSARLTFEKKP